MSTAAVAVLAMIGGQACQYNTTVPTQPTSGLTTSGTPTTATTTGTTTGTGGLTYVADAAPILNSDCVRCHGPSRRDAGVDLSTYSNVLRFVSPGSANSILILVTQPGGIMYGQFSGNRSQKAATIHDWIVASNAAQQ